MAKRQSSQSRTFCRCFAMPGLAAAGAASSATIGDGACGWRPVSALMGGPGAGGAAVAALDVADPREEERRRAGGEDMV